MEHVEFTNPIRMASRNLKTKRRGYFMPSPLNLFRNKTVENK
jgi:hypothetical protein